jgi:exodeoxyribonuclease V alpha subunit
MNKAQTFSGRVTSVVYQTEDFRILKALLDGGKPTPVTIRGHFPAQNVVLGSWVSFEAKWVDHPQYGKQLNVTRSPVALGTWTDDRVMSALSANQVGPQLRLNLQMLAQSKDIGLAELLDEGNLDDLPVDDLTKTYVVGRWRSLRAHLDAAQFLSEAGVPSKVIGKVWGALGDELEEKITEDPWILVRLGGISFQEADEVASRLGVDRSNKGRINGAVLTAVQDVATEGHVFAGTGQIVSAVGKMIPGVPPSPKAVAQAIKDLHDDKQLVVDREFGGVSVYELWVEEMERDCSEILLRRAAAASAIPEHKAVEELDKWARGRKVTLTETQKKAALNALVESVSVLTGLPGTGKTTTLQAVVSVLRDEAVPFLLVAPTGIAAKRLETVTGADASTVHRAFSAKGWNDDEREATYVGIVGDAEARKGGDTKSEHWGYGPGNPHPAQVVIVDESSMLDLHMLYRLLRGTSEECRLVFVGDPYQLPSVGAGDVLRDLKMSGRFSHIHLDEIFRQEDTSSIVSAAHAIHAGNVPDMTDKDFLLLATSESDDGLEASKIIRKIAIRLYEKQANFQVLSPRHKGEAGVTNLNEILRMAINPPSPGLAERNVAGSTVREGDRIMVVKNDYNVGVYNGDVGKISRIDHRNKQLAIRVFAPPGQPEQEVRYDVGKGAPPIRLAYAQTIHKSQGQEYDIIVVPMLKSFGWQLQRNLLYTAITRAKKRVFLVGHASAIRKAVGNDRADQRNTNLSLRLQRGLPQGG